MQGRLIETATSNKLWTPAVLLSVQDAVFSSEHAQKALDDFSHRDDVFSDDFSSTLILQSIKDINIGDTIAKLAGSRIFESIYTKESTSESVSLPPGPYFIHGKSIHQAWKLYEDDLDAFVVPTITDDISNPKRLADSTLCSHLSFCTDALFPSVSLYYKQSHSMVLSEALLCLVDFTRARAKRSHWPALA